MPRKDRQRNNCRVLQVSGKALAAGFSAAPEPVASAIPLSYFFADPKIVVFFGEAHHDEDCLVSDPSSSTNSVRGRLEDELRPSGWIVLACC
jgi:hypothetical protein